MTKDRITALAVFILGTATLTWAMTTNPEKSGVHRFIAREYDLTGVPTLDAVTGKMYFLHITQRDSEDDTYKDFSVQLHSDGTVSVGGTLDAAEAFMVMHQMDKARNEKCNQLEEKQLNITRVKDSL